MGLGTAGQAAGTSTLGSAATNAGTAANYFQNILQGGRTGAAAASAPAINAQLAQTDATTKQLGEFGTGRSGGAVASQQQAKTAGQSNIDNIINQTIGGSATGLTSAAQTQAGIGSAQLSNALALMGLGSGDVNQILSNATGSRAQDPNVGLSIGKAVGQLFLGALAS